MPRRPAAPANSDVFVLQEVASIVTQIVVDTGDPAFSDPVSKALPFPTKEMACR